MTELPFCLQPSKISDNNDYESYKKGEFELEEWEDVNYCEHSFNHGDNGLTDREVVDLLYAQNKEIEQLKQQLAIIGRLIDNKIDEFKNGDYGDLPYNAIHMFLDLKQEIGDDGND